MLTIAHVGFGMLSVALAVVTSMTGCSSNTCGAPGIVITAPTEQIIDVLASDVACAGVMPSCEATDGAGTCTKYLVLPIAAGNCHIDVDLVKGTRFSTDVKVAAGAGSCSAEYYPEIAAQANIEVP